jgi:hypothetical protein
LKQAPLAFILLLGLTTGLCGIRSGLPGPQRWRALPPALRSSPEFAQRLADSWRRLYDAIQKSHEQLKTEEPVTYVQGLVEVPPGWTFPPDPLINSARSLITQTESPDEKKSFIILSRMRPWKLEFEPLYAQYGGAFIYPFGAFLGAAHVIGLAHLTPDLAHYLVHPEDMGRLYLLGRIFILLFHLGTLWVLYEMGLLLGGRRAGLAAALLFAAAPFIAVGSHTLKPHPVAAFWFAASALFMIRAVEGGRRKDFLACGACAGLAAGGILTLLFGAGMPLLAGILAARSTWRRAGAGTLLAVALTAAFNPFLILSPKTFAWELTIQIVPRWGLAPDILKDMLLQGLPHGIGLAATVLLAAGLFRGAFGADRRAQALAWVAIAGSTMLWLRFSALGGESLLRVFYGPFALACVLGAALLTRLPPAAAGLVLALALVESGARASTYLTNLSLSSGPNSTRELAADWIDANVPAGASVGLLRFPEPAHTPPFRWDRLNLKIFDKPEALGKNLPDWIAAEARAWETVDASLRGRYVVAHAAPSAAPLGIRMTDVYFFANADFLVLRKNG